MTGQALWGMKIAGEIQEILERAKSEVWLISPYTKTQSSEKGDDLLVRSIKSALSRGVRVQMVLRTNEKSPGRLPADIAPLVDAGMKLYEVDNLHAKLYLAGDRALVTSLNLYAPTRSTTLDLGISIGPGPLLDQLKEFLGNHIKPHMRPIEKKKPKKVSKPKPAPRPVRGKRRSAEEGNCIRCGWEIAFNPRKPLCLDCFDEWDQWGNADYPENHCHMCGNWTGETSMRKPLCIDCFG